MKFRNRFVKEPISKLAHHRLVFRNINYSLMNRSNVMPIKIQISLLSFQLRLIHINSIIDDRIEEVL